MLRFVQSTLRPLACATAFALASTGAFASDAPATYGSPQEALDALIAALGTGTALEVFGEAAQDLLSTGNAERDAENRDAFLLLYEDGYRFRNDGPDTVVVLLGATSWPFAVPLSRGDAGWFFDAEAGREELLFRRIGLNELDTIDMMRAYVEAQAMFRSVDQDGDGVMEFAPALLSSAPSVRDGLFWGDADSILGERIALASLEGYNDGTEDRPAEPFGGYYYRILTSQGDAAPGGAMDYMMGDHLMGGHAMLAVPAAYGDSGIHSFIIAENGVLYQADLGEDTLGTAATLTSFDPTDGWTVVE